MSGLGKGIGFSRAVVVVRMAALAAEVLSGSNSVVESQPSKLLVVGSIPISRSILRRLAGVSESEGLLAKSRAFCAKDLISEDGWASSKQPSRSSGKKSSGN